METDTEKIDLRGRFDESGLSESLEQLDRELIGLEPVKVRIREIAAYLLLQKIRSEKGIDNAQPTLHMSFTGNPGTGKTTVAMKMAKILHNLGYTRTDTLVAVTRDDLVGQYIGHTAPKTKEVLKRAMGGVLFIDEAYYLYRPENEKDYGQETIEILLQMMENERAKLVVILAGYKDKMETFFSSNPGFKSRISHHVDFPDYTEEELFSIARLMIRDKSYLLEPETEQTLARYIRLRKSRPHFANARSIRNAVERAIFRHAARLLHENREISVEDLKLITPADFLKSEVFNSDS